MPATRGPSLVRSDVSEIRVGISGWTYTPWRGNFYPQGLPQKLELAFAARRFSTLEINGTFYSLQLPSSFATWHDQTPPGFVFALKGSRYITHLRRLKDIDTPLANFFASGLLNLRAKLGPILWQFPPFMRFNADRFRAFFDLLPRDTMELARFARRHDAGLNRAVALDPDARRPVRHAVEFRHESFMTEAFVSLLREYNIALVIADVASKFPTAEDITADWVYVRLHGSRQLYASGYTPREIEAWARKVELWSAGREPTEARRIAARPPRASPPATAPITRPRDIYIYFDNTDVKLRAPIDARRMAERLSVGPSASAAAVLADLGAEPAGKSPSSRTRKPGRAAAPRAKPAAPPVATSRWPARRSKATTSPRPKRKPSARR